jgi:hypothetical protein
MAPECAWDAMSTPFWTISVGSPRAWPLGQPACSKWYPHARQRPEAPATPPARKWEECTSCQARTAPSSLTSGGRRSPPRSRGSSSPLPIQGAKLATATWNWQDRSPSMIYCARLPMCRMSLSTIATTTPQRCFGNERDPRQPPDPPHISFDCKPYTNDIMVTRHCMTTYQEK